MRRPSSRSYSGVVAPSTTLNTHTSAATLMNSGTVTKKPATKLRRSHCIDVREERDAQRDAVPRERAEAVAPHVAEERPHHRGRRRERHDEAHRDLPGAR